MGDIKVRGPDEAHWPQGEGRLPHPKPGNRGVRRGQTTLFRQILSREITEAERREAEKVSGICSEVAGGENSRLGALVETLKDLPEKGDPSFDGVVMGSLLLGARLQHTLNTADKLGELGDVKSRRLAELSEAVAEAGRSRPGSSGLMDFEA